MRICVCTSYYCGLVVGLRARFCEKEKKEIERQERERRPRERRRETRERESREKERKRETRVRVRERQSLMPYWALDPVVGWVTWSCLPSSPSLCKEA